MWIALRGQSAITSCINKSKQEQPALAGYAVSQPFMLAIAIMYLGASICFAWEGKAAWCGLSICWGAGNLILAYISK
jgi:hypothetical protein